MKIAIPTRDNHVDNHFGHCAYYTIITTDADNNITGEEILESPEGCGCKSNIAGTLNQIGVSIMLAGNMGQGAVNKLTESHIKVIRGCSGEVKDVVRRYLAGEITDNEQVCDHHDCSHH